MKEEEKQDKERNKMRSKEGRGGRYKHRCMSYLKWKGKTCEKRISVGDDYDNSINVNLYSLNLKISRFWHPFFIFWYSFC